ncbi:TIGR03279 family radical SAM protein [Prochlorococcus marinus]|uniref:Possible Fe-S oxidoreductase n=1 Tax=Prochlorococcus marinus (strain MIT 9211) TaxID=93059 RepID=A9BCV4_PROM4|nr:TIGR03279 family radical SAM protein [Prochlorococcus marinus]ABX08042.1 possible Fe-S oxidoreductase [Prochlorococcus marinus str. MIT 9211]
MWNEPSLSVAEKTQQSNGIKDPRPAVVESVEPGSIGEDLGFEPGDQVISINGVKPRDLIDYRYLIVEEELDLEVIDKTGKVHQINFEKDNDEGLGLAFTEALFDGINQCNNQCPFCFIDQQPEGRRKSLYIKDDDFRMSFLYGSYLTLTNLGEKDWGRIEKQRLSPLFVSVHATDPNLRIKLLNNNRAGLIMKQIEWFSKRNLQLHAQVVVCPGLNDGKALENTLNDLFRYSKGEWPVILSTAVVPVGLTRFRPKNDCLKPVDTKCAKTVIDQVERLQENYKSFIGTNFAWLSDEWYLLAGKELPRRESYEDLPQEENGVGSIRSFLESMDQATQHLPKKINTPRQCSWVVGKLVEDALKPACARLNKIDLFSINLFGLSSTYWGQDKVVTGLLTGQDLIQGLQNENLGERLLVPSVMLRHEMPIFLDDMHIDEVSKALKIPIDIVYSPSDFINKAIGKGKNVT